MDRVEAGRLGGLTTAARYGRGHMSDLGTKGFATYCERYHKGDRASAVAVLKRNGANLDGVRRRWLPTPSEWTNWLEGRAK
jgi:hypothetical protein